MQRSERFLERNWPIKTILTLVICGYVFGVCLTLLWHFTYHPGQNVLTAKWFGIIVGVLFCMILCYGRTVRCILTLSLPTLCTSEGRALVIAAAFFFAATCPTVNIIKNLAELMRNLSCGQTQLMDALDHMLDIMRQPLLAVEQALQLVMAELRKVLSHVEKMMERIESLVVLILATFRSCAQWLNDIISVCNHELGTPYERCMRYAGDGIAKCLSKMGPMSVVCLVKQSFKVICQSVKFVDYFCAVTWEFNDELIQYFMHRLKMYAKEIEEIFRVDVEFDRDYYFHQHASRNLTQVTDDIVAHIDSRMRWFFMVFGWLDIVGTLLIFCVLLRSIYFYLRYLHSLEYRNVYLTPDFFEIDAQRRKTQQEAVLPLKRTERSKYIKLTSCRLLKFEVLLMARTMLFMIITTIQLFCICFTDYSLYWLLSAISYHAHRQGGLEVPAYVKIEVRGEGFIADIVRGITHAFEPMTESYAIDLTPCMPVPRPPNYLCYLHITALCVLAWLILLLEPYGLRVLHFIMRWYYPDHAKRRALHLYNKILTRRVSFFKFARRKARAAFLYQDTEAVSCLQWFRAKLNRYWCCRFLCCISSDEVCIMCSKTLNDSSRIRCDTPGCKGVYCKICFSQSDNTCCLCKRPIDYGDYSDLSEVQDSSDDEKTAKRKHENNKYCAPNRNKKKP